MSDLSYENVKSWKEIENKKETLVLRKFNKSFLALSTEIHSLVR